MKQEDEIKLLVKNVAIKSINIPIINHDLIKNLVYAKVTYKNQTEDKKKLPLSRFWKHCKTPLSLTEQCALTIAEQVVKNDITYHHNKLPAAINEIIDFKMQQIRENIEHEVIMQKINDVLHAQQIAFDSSREDDSRVKPR